MNAAECLKGKLSYIAEEWERRVRAELAAARAQEHFTLKDNVPEFLNEMIKSLERRSLEVISARNLAESHAVERMTLPEYNLEEVLAEYRIMLQVVFDVLSATGIEVSGHERNIIFELIHRGKAAAARKYSELAVKREQEIAKVLREAEEFRRLMIESSEDCFNVLDLQGKLLDVSDRSLEHLEIDKRESILNKPWSLIWERPEDRAAIDEAVQCAREGSTGRFIGYHRTRSGKREWWEVVISPMRAINNQVERLLAVLRDVTDRKKLEEDRDRLVERLESLQTVSDAALSRTTSLPTLLEKSLEAVSETVNCDTIAILLVNEKEDVLEVRAAVGFDEEMRQKLQVPKGKGVAGKIFASGQSVKIDDMQGVEVASPIVRDQQIRCLIGAPLRTKSKILGVMHVGRLKMRPFSEGDLSLLKLTADRLATAIENAQLYDSLQFHIRNLEFERGLREQFVNTLTHDLRSPLTAAKASAQMIVRHPERTDKIPELAVRTATALERVDRMIQDLLDTSRIRAGRSLPLDIQECDVTEVVKAVVEDFTTHHGRRFRVEDPGKLIATISRKDFIRVLENLIGNAIKYGSNDEILIRVAKSPSDQFEVSVHNWGNPIPPQEQSTLFELYVRGSSVDRGKKKGWGLGLTLVKGVAEAHGGRVSLRSSEVDGTTFCVTLPLRTPAQKAA